jgi:nucleoside-diphosphate-sugar epimerase
MELGPPIDLAGARCVVTGAAGFVGSHLAERLLAMGATVVGVDSFTDYYDRGAKESNLEALRGRRGFDLVTSDLAEEPIEPWLESAVVVFHQAGQPGVRASWGAGFAGYARNNVIATQRLLEACRDRPGLRRLVNASSSSVYGDAESLPTSEDVLPLPVSPYGVTKLAAEHLCRAYAVELGVPAVSLRYFTVYGPRQRPDMAFTRFCRALLAGAEIRVHGDGRQTRDFTYVDDIVTANVAAATAPADRVVGNVYNLGGGTRITVNEVLKMLFRLAGRKTAVRHVEDQPGDARHTAAETARARHDLGFLPATPLEEGLQRQLKWATAVRA